MTNLLKETSYVMIYQSSEQPERDLVEHYPSVFAYTIGDCFEYLLFYYQVIIVKMRDFSIFFFLCYRLAKNVNTVSVKKKKSATFLRQGTY